MFLFLSARPVVPACSSSPGCFLSSPADGVFEGVGKGR